MDIRETWTQRPGSGMELWEWYTEMKLILPLVRQPLDKLICVHYVQSNFFFSGPFAMQGDRAEIVDFSLPVYTGHIVALIPLKMVNNQDALIKPFDWRSWVVIASLPPTYLLFIALSEYVFNHDVNWWKLINFTLNPIFMQGVPRLPEANMYNRIFSINWIMMTYVLGLAYLGMSYAWLCRL